MIISNKILGAGLTIEVVTGEAKETPNGAYEYIVIIEIKFIDFISLNVKCF